ncbi:COPII coat Sec23p-Sfb3p heterodimer component [Agyrium rufum]|nr:COPII coat Sec23p-Sfb3p heterodimer component [Agyrium rufum]
MADYSTYHALGEQDDSQDPSQPQVRTQPAAPAFRPPIASKPSEYQQNLRQTNAPHPVQFKQVAETGYQVSRPGTPQEQGYFPPHGQIAQAYGNGSADQLASPMSAMGLGPECAGGATRTNRKKNRHAYHNLDQSTPNAQQPQGLQQGHESPGHPYTGQPITPAMHQFPAPSGGAFQPSNPAFAQGHQPQAPASTGVTAQGKVDPEQIPSLPRARDAAAQYYLEHVYQTMEQHLPPTAAVPFVAFDQGNSSPKFARLTLNNIPASSEALTATGIPLGLILQPLAPLQTGEQPIPVLDFGETGPPRCRRCRTYINPFMTFRSGGNKFVCNMCTFPNDVPVEYFAPTDPSGVRVDRDQRPELKLGTVEYVVPKEYWAKEPHPLRYLFLIDVSQEAINRGLLEAFCEGVLGALYATEEPPEDESHADVEPPRNLPEGCKVGFVTYDREIHFYNCNSNLDQAQMVVMPDIEDPFVPLGSDGLFVDPYESQSIITTLLSRLPMLFTRIKNDEPALLPTLNAALSALSTTGGKVICSLSSLPTWGPGRLFMRDDNKLHGIETERKLFQTEHPGWRKLGSEMVKSGIGADFFITSPGGAYMDIATIGHVSAITGGETYHYPNFHAPRDSYRLAQEVRHTVVRETGYQALMKVRCSNGLQISAYHGNFLQHTFGADLEFGVIDADKAVGVMFSYDGKLDAKLDAHFQCALLYTTTNGERRVRCTNTVASISEGAIESMRYIDQDAIVSILAKEAATRMTERSLKEIRNHLNEKTIDILAGYRKSFSGSHPPGQLVLPENLKEFSMYMLGLLKCRAFKAGGEPSDRRSYIMRLIKSASPQELTVLLYPRIIALHSLEPTEGFADANTGHLALPPTIRASFANIEEGGAYLIDDGQTCILWLHARVSPHLLEDLFGPDYTLLKALDPYMSALPVLETHLNCQARNIIAYWSTLRSSRQMALQLARQGLDGSEFEFARLLVEDRNSEAQSYVDWLVHVHRSIQLELAGQRGKKDDDGGGGLTEGLRAMGW